MKILLTDGILISTLVLFRRAGIERRVFHASPCARVIPKRTASIMPLDIPFFSPAASEPHGTGPRALVWKRRPIFRPASLAIPRQKSRTTTNPFCLFAPILEKRVCVWAIVPSHALRSRVKSWFSRRCRYVLRPATWSYHSRCDEMT